MDIFLLCWGELMPISERRYLVVDFVNGYLVSPGLILMG
jgi:hypothetical protein